MTIYGNYTQKTDLQFFHEMGQVFSELEREKPKY